MPKRNRLTNNSDETDIASLISGDTIFSIPYFQRAYKWKTERLRQLERDILDIVDGTSDFHFLGAVIVHGRRKNPSDPDVFDVIDGQQRITTLFLYIAAIIRILSDLKEYDEASSLFLKYLVISRQTNLLSNLKLHSCKEDRAQLNLVITDVLNNKYLKEKMGFFKPKLLPPSGRDTGTLLNNYKSALRFLKGQHEQEGLERIRAFLSALLNSMSVVQIDVWDPTNGPKIFDSLNSRQEPMTIGDLVRNEIFSRVASEHPDKIEEIDQHSWQPFYKRFQQDSKNLFDSYFFPYGLIIDPNLKKSEVYGALREQWKDIADPEKIVENLSFYQNAFIDITCGTNHMKHSKAIARLFKNIWSSNAPSSVYPFLMPLSRAISDKSIPEKTGVEILEVVESFLIRRAICGHEPTGLHSVFKRLWVDCDKNPTKERVIKEISKHKTVVWPQEDIFKEAIENRPLYGVSITPYVLLEIDKSLGGDQPHNIPWQEHILPLNPDKEWFNTFSKDEHESQKDLLANLIPLSQAMNTSLGNKIYTAKRDRYKKDSMFKSARNLAESYVDWTPKTIDKRGKHLAKWAVSRWPY